MLDLVTISHGWNINPFHPDRSRVEDDVDHDALGNVTSSVLTTSYDFGIGPVVNSTSSAYTYLSGTGRLARTADAEGEDTLYYDFAGNTQFSTRISNHFMRDRAS